MGLIRNGTRILRAKSGKLAHSLNCCCKKLNCSQKLCDCAVTTPPCLSAPSYRYRMKTGDFTNCLPNCFDQVNTNFVNAGAGPGGVGISMARLGGTSCCSFGPGATIGVCNCAIQPAMITPGQMGVLTLMGCEEYNGECRVRAKLAIANAEFMCFPFRLDATIAAPNVMTLIAGTTFPCCNTPTEMEVWAG